jgi:ATP-binding cassette subfamily B protein
MIAALRPLLDWLAGLVDPFAPADGAPPRSLWAFAKWCLAGSWPMIWLAILFSAIAGTMEVVSAWLLGLIIDSVVGTGDAARYFTEHWWLIVGYVVFFLLLRPLMFAASAAFNGIVLPPNLAPLIQSRLHRWTLGHAVTFFDNDFAGRIAQKQTQTANALVNVVSETINAVAFALASLIGSVVLLLVIDWQIALALVVWLAGYFWMISWFLPRIRKVATARAGARANVTGQIVDTITNIKIVKLFGHSAVEDSAAISALRTYRARSLEFGNLSTGFRLALMTVAGALPVILVLGGVLLWQQGQATPGDIAAIGSVAMRIAQMTGWVSFTLMGIYTTSTPKPESSRGL